MATKETSSGVIDAPPIGCAADSVVVVGRQGAHVSEMQRRRLLLSFADILAREGLDAAGVGRVCRGAGVSRRTFYELFSDREACFLATLEEVVGGLLERVVGAYTSGGPARRVRSWRERIRAALTALLEYFDEEPVQARVCLIETLKAGPKVVEYRRRVLAELVDAIDEGRGEAKPARGPAPLTAESIVGGAMSVVHARLLDGSPRPLTDLVNPLMSMIVNPYLGSAAARRELERLVPDISPRPRGGLSPSYVREPFKDLSMRMTFRTARVLAAIGEYPDASNRVIGDAAGISDQGQISKLLRRLERYGLVCNNGNGRPMGEPNAWRLTERGHAVQQAIQAPEITPAATEARRSASA